MFNYTDNNNTDGDDDNNNAKIPNVLISVKN